LEKGRVQVEKQAVESKDPPKWRPVVCSKEKLLYVGVILPAYTAYGDGTDSVL